MNKQDVRDVIDRVIERLVREEFQERIKKIEERLDALESGHGMTWWPTTLGSTPTITGTMAYAVGEMSSVTSGELTINTTGTFVSDDELFETGEYFEP